MNFGFSRDMKTDQLVEDIKRQTANGDFRGLAKQLQTCNDVLRQLDSSSLDSMIDCLDLKCHSLGAIALLSARLHRYTSDFPWQKFLHQMKVFVSNMALDQVQCSPVAFCELIHHLTEMLCLKKRAIEGIEIVCIAVEAYSPSPTCLTAIHSDLIQLCLMAKCLKPALKFLERNYIDLLTEDNQFDVKYVLLFYYYGGMVYTCLHNYLNALLFFTVCLSGPSLAVSAIMVAAYKKFVLVSLLKFGKVISLPRYCNHLVDRIIKPMCPAYSELAKVYAGSNSDIQGLISKYSDAFTKDGNLGLVNRLVDGIHRYNVQRLTHTFMTLGLSDLSSRVGINCAEAEKYIRDMIEDGQIHASLDQMKQMVSFTENPENFDSSVMVKHIDEQLSDCMSLERTLSAIDKELAVDPRYVHRTMGSGPEDDPLFHDEAVM